MDQPQAHVTGLVRVELVNGFYFAIAETFNYSAEVLRDVIGVSAFSAADGWRVKGLLEARGYAVEFD